MQKNDVMVAIALNEKEKEYSYFLVLKTYKNELLSRKRYREAKLS
jgi:hypothetical protein